ncbi:hypothetical protein [Rhizobium sp. Leaf262]|uniref:hypothetical protein n=1 Tax=Rhizobium sp. Leaf262 TaxID=1736312 RepID=UPI000715E865|nr:hypothetical protein [Rhizobium sp. Leaf262]KQO79447.1 hypothetical protein ASF29_23340 [Rhizobium sp. Leaf262]
MAITLKTTLTPITSTFSGGQNSLFGVNVNDFHVFTWGEAPTSPPDAPLFCGSTHLWPNERHVLQTNGWLPDAIDGVVTAPLQIPFSSWLPATEAAIKDLFRDADQLTLAPYAGGYHVLLNGNVVLRWERHEDGAFFCFDSHQAQMNKERIAITEGRAAPPIVAAAHRSGDDEGVFCMDNIAGSARFVQFSNDILDVWDEGDIEQVTPFAYLAMIRGWAE